MSRSESPFVRAPIEDEGYNSIHRAFLQAFQTNGVLTVEEMKPILAHIMTAYSKLLYKMWAMYDTDISHRPQPPMD